MSFKFNPKCPRCGSPCAVVTVGQVVAGRELSAIVRCTSCPPSTAEWQVMVRMTPVNERATIAGRPPAVCGTDTGYYRHVRQLHESACIACLSAHSASTLARKRQAGGAK